MNWSAKKTKYLINFIILLITLESTVYFGNNSENKWIWEIICLVIALFLTFLSYGFDNWYPIKCSTNNFCSEYFCQVFFQLLSQDAKESILFSTDGIKEVSLNEIGNDKHRHKINKTVHNITSQRNYKEYTLACEFASKKARKSLIMTYPNTPFEQMDDDEDIISKITNSGRKKLKIQKYIYISPNKLSDFCSRIVKEYLKERDSNTGVYNLKTRLKMHPIYKYINAHNKYDELNWISGDSTKEIFIADDNIALSWDHVNCTMKVEFQKGSFAESIPMGSGLKTKAFFHEKILPKVNTLLDNSTILREDRKKYLKQVKEIKYCLGILDIYHSLLISVFNK